MINIFKDDLYIPISNKYCSSFSTFYMLFFLLVSDDFTSNVAIRSAKFNTHACM